MLRFAAVFGLLGCLLVLGGCPSPMEIGGGGSEHVPPTQLHVGDPLKVDLTLHVWGEGGPATGRWTQVKCLYKHGSTAAFTLLPMTKVSSTAEKEVYTATIPAGQVAGEQLVYGFTMLLDGHPNTHEGATLTLLP